jgi:hypothetical protein
MDEVSCFIVCGMYVCTLIIPTDPPCQLAFLSGPVQKTKEFADICGIDTEKEKVVGCIWYGFTSLANADPKRRKKTVRTTYWSFDRLAYCGAPTTGLKSCLRTVTFRSYPNVAISPIIVS